MSSGTWLDKCNYTLERKKKDKICLQWCNISSTGLLLYFIKYHKENKNLTEHTLNFLHKGLNGKNTGKGYIRQISIYGKYNRSSVASVCP